MEIPGGARSGRMTGGRPRDPELDAAIAKATRTLLEDHGLGGLTLEGVARRAGVARATIYRRWPNRNALLVHLLRGLVREFPVPDRGNVRDDLIELLRLQLGVLENEGGKLYPSLGAQAAVDPTAGDVLADLVRHRRAALETVLLRGMERDEIRSDLDLDLCLFSIWGPVYYRYLGALAGKAPIEPNFIVKLVDSVLDGVGTPTQRGRTTSARRASAVKRAR